MQTDDTVDKQTERTISIPSHLVDRIDSRLSCTEFETPDEYITYILEETLARLETRTDQEETQIDENDVRNRLQSLGYLDS